MLLFVIKVLHSIAILYFMACLWVVWVYALSGAYFQWMKWVLASLLAEGLVFIGFGFECPLTIWALNLGDDTGSDLLSDIFYLEQVDFVTNYVLFCFVGLVFAGRRYLSTKNQYLRSSQHK